MAFVISLLDQLFGRNPFDATAISDLSEASRSGGDENISARPRTPAQRPPPISTARSPNNFVDVLVQVVTRDIVRRRLEDKVQTLQTKIDSSQKSHDALKVFSENLSKRQVPEVQTMLDELRERVDRQRGLLETEWRDEYGRVYTCGLKDLLTTAESDQRLASRARNESMAQLLQNVDAVIDAAFDTGRVAGLPMGRSICGRLKTLCGCARLLEENEQQLRALDSTRPRRAEVQEALQMLTAAKQTEDPELISRETANVLRARNAFALAVKTHGVSRRTLEVQRRNQRLREEEFFDKMAFPVLVRESHLLARNSPSLPPTPSSLERFSVSGSVVEGRDGPESTGQNSVESESGSQGSNERLISIWRKAQQLLADAEREHEELCYDHISTLAEHLAAFDRATLATAEREYERKTGNTFLGREEQARREVDGCRKTYERAKAVARQTGIEDLPLSPIAYAENSRDGRTESAGSGWYQLIQGEARKDYRRVLRWSRMIARGRPRRSPRASPSWSISSVGSLKPADEGIEGEPSDRAMLDRYKRKLDNVRPVAERERGYRVAEREGGGGRDDGPSRETRAQKRQRLGEGASI